MWLCRYFVFFVMYSCMGWIYESTFCSIKAKKWENRGFLYGPVVPIYGAGGVGLLIVIDCLSAKGIGLTWWQLLLLGYFGSIVLEYGTSWALEKLFHARWWDYSDMPCNINGRVCLPYSICFALAALLVNYAIIPFSKMITGWMTPILFELFGMIFMGLVAADTMMTVTALTDFNRRFNAMEESFNKRMESMVDNAFVTIDEKRAIYEERKLQKALEEMESETADKRRLPSREELAARFNKDAREQYMAGLSALRRSALKRVQIYRNPKDEAETRRAQEFLAELKKKLPKREK